MMDVHYYCAPVDEMTNFQSSIMESYFPIVDLSCEFIDDCGYVEDSEEQMKEVVLDSDDDAREEHQGTASEPGKRGHLTGSFSGRAVVTLPRRRWLPSAYTVKRGKGMASGLSTTRFLDHDIVMSNTESKPPPQKQFHTDAKEFQQTDQDCVSKPGTKADRNNDFEFEGDVCNDMEFPESSASQGTALEFVNYFISAGDFELDHDEENRKTEKMRSPPSLRSRGTQSLAKRIGSTFDANMSMAFEWSEKEIEHHDQNAMSVHSRGKLGTDDGGPGSLSVHRRDDKVSMQKELKETLPGNAVCHDVVDGNLWMACDPEERDLDLTNLLAYDSVEMDENIDVDLPEETLIKGDASGFERDSFGLEIGLGTQIAVEAMEALKHATSSMSSTSFSFLGSDNLASNRSSGRHFVGWGSKGKRSNRLIASAKNSENAHLVYSRKLKKTTHSDLGVVCSKLNSDPLLEVGRDKAQRTVNSYEYESVKMKACINPKTSRENRVKRSPLRNEILVYTRKRKTPVKGEQTSYTPNMREDQFSQMAEDREKKRFQVRRTECVPLHRTPMMKELSRLGYQDIPDFSPRKRTSRRKVCILFSQHIGASLIKRQKKIVSRLGLSIASCCKDATHFVADKFVRTMNMLEAIALGKPVVTHLWLDGCDQAGCLIEEKSYILRDEKKEKEIGFRLPASITRAQKHPLLKGMAVLITPNAKPSIDMIRVLVSATQGQAIQSLEGNVIPESVLVISSQEDHAICLGLLEKGAAAIYSSELLFNGILTQKLEYQRYRIFPRA